MANNNNELEKRNQAFLIYQDENGIVRINVRFEGEDGKTGTVPNYPSTTSAVSPSICADTC